MAGKGAEAGAEPGSMTLRAIGFVRSEIKEPSRREFGDIISEVVIDESLTEALDGLDEFSHITVLYWIHRAAPGYPLKVHPRGDLALPAVGLFATRSPQRPNRIGKTTVRLLRRQDNVLTVQGLDAISGSPVIDIKPYLPRNDCVLDADIPSWVRRD
jgi:tRNA-Thr(GGU) m(6)t(6)A37 methyltransferase TsaA